MSTRASIEITCDSHPGQPRVVTRLTDCRTVPWPASPAELAAHGAPRADMVSQLLPDRPVPPPVVPIWGIAVTRTGRQRGDRVHEPLRVTATGGRVEINPHGQRRYTFQCSDERCRRRPPLVIGAPLLGRLMDSAIRDKAHGRTLDQLRREIRSLTA